MATLDRVLPRAAALALALTACGDLGATEALTPSTPASTPVEDTSPTADVVHFATYQGDLRGPLAQQCVVCHRRDRLAEPDLDGYVAVRNNAHAIIDVLDTHHDGELPIGSDGCSSTGGLALDGLSGLVDAWIASGYPAGESAQEQPEDPLDSASRRLGAPDFVMSASAPLALDSQPLVRCIEVHLDETRFARALQVRAAAPGRSRSLDLFALPPGLFDWLDDRFAEDSMPGYACGSEPPGELAFSWRAGQPPLELGVELPLWLQANLRYVARVRYGAGEPVTDAAPSVQLWTSAATPSDVLSFRPVRAFGSASQLGRCVHDGQGLGAVHGAVTRGTIRRATIDDGQEGTCLLSLPVSGEGWPLLRHHADVVVELPVQLSLDCAGPAGAMCGLDLLVETSIAQATATPCTQSACGAACGAGDVACLLACADSDGPGCVACVLDRSLECTSRACSPSTVALADCAEPCRSSCTQQSGCVADSCTSQLAEHRPCAASEPSCAHVARRCGFVP